MLILDRVSLYTRLLSYKLLSVVRNHLESDPFFGKHTSIPIDNPMEMLLFCVQTKKKKKFNNFFINQYDEGLAMGSPLIPVMANLYIEYFKEMTLWTKPLELTVWITDRNDNFILRLHQDGVKILLDHVNSGRPSIRFTMEAEKTIINLTSWIYEWLTGWMGQKQANIHGKKEKKTSIPTINSLKRMRLSDAYNTMQKSCGDLDIYQLTYSSK